MASPGKLRRKMGPMRGRLEEIIKDGKEFLSRGIEKESEEYLLNLRRIWNTLSTRLGVFKATEENLQELSKGNKEEEEILSTRDEAYITIPLEGEEILNQLREYEREIIESKEKQEKKTRDEREFEYRKSLEPDNTKHEQELNKEREAWKLQLEEMQHKEETRKQELQAEMEKERLQINFELEKQKLDLERARLQMEERLKLREAEIQLEVAKLGANSSTQANMAQVASVNKNVKLPKLDFPKFSGNILKWKEFWDSFTGAIDQNTSLSQVDKLNYLKTKLEGTGLAAISGLELSGDNYPVAVDLLKERFGKDRLVKEAHYNRLMAIPLSSRDISKLRTTFDEIEMHLRTLEAMGEDITHSYLISVIKSKIPQEIMEQIEILKGDEEWTVKLLRDRLRHHLAAKEESSRLQSNANDYKGINPKSNPLTTGNFGTGGIGNNYRRSAPTSTTQALVTMNKQIWGRSCAYCSGDHYSDECKKYSDLDSRRKRVKSCCYLCLRKNHTSDNCLRNQKCVYCNLVRSHHRSLCPKQFSSNRDSTESEVVELNTVEENSSSSIRVHIEETKTTSMFAISDRVIMQTAISKVENPDTHKEATVRIFLDSGSQRSYITNKLMKELDLLPKAIENLSIQTFGSKERKHIKSPRVEIDLITVSKEKVRLELSVIPYIADDIPRVPQTLIDGTMLENYVFSERAYHADKNMSIDILIGNDYYYDIMEGIKLYVTPGLYLINSKIGWIISGRTSDSPKDMAKEKKEDQIYSMKSLIHQSHIT